MRLTSSPWGSVQHRAAIAPGICQVMTASHGGIKLDAERNALVPSYMRRASGWYEEDCEWSIPFVALASYIVRHADRDSTRQHVQHASTTLRSWYPDEYERFFGVTLKPGQSMQRDQQNWNAEHATELQVVSALSVTGQPDLVNVAACIGGRTDNGHYAGPLRYFIVPTSEYKQRTRHRFIVDPARHAETAETF